MKTTCVSVVKHGQGLIFTVFCLLRTLSEIKTHENMVVKQPSGRCGQLSPAAEKNNAEMQSRRVRHRESGTLPPDVCPCKRPSLQEPEKTQKAWCLQDLVRVHPTWSRKKSNGSQACIQVQGQAGKVVIVMEGGVRSLTARWHQGRPSVFQQGRTTG